MKKKSLLVLLLVLFVMVGCSSASNSEDNETPVVDNKVTLAAQIIEAMNVDTIKNNLVSDMTLETVEVKEADQASIFATKTNSAEYDAFMEAVVAQMESEKGHLTISRIGSGDQGMTVITFPRFVSADVSYIDAINSTEGVMDVYVYKNVLVTVTPNFVTDSNIIFSELDSVLPTIQTK